MIDLSLDDSAETSVAVSPFVQAVSALRLIGQHGSDAPPPHRRWVQQLRSNVEPRTWQQMRVVGREVGATFRSRTMASSRVIGASNLEQAIAQLETEQSSAARKSFIETLRAVDTFALVPWWPDVLRLLDSEARRCDRVLNLSSGSQLLRVLRGRLEPTPPGRDAEQQQKTLRPSTYAVRKLTFCPTVFGRSLHLVALDEHTRHGVLAFPARGAGTVPPAPGAGRERAHQVDRLAILLGDGRAKVLRALIEPSSTTDVSAALAFAPSTVSQHLSSLSEAGVVRKSRRGRRVLYELTADGFEVLRRIDTR